MLTHVVVERHELRHQKVLIPHGQLRDPIVGHDIGALLDVAKAAQIDARDLLQAETYRGQDPTVPGEYLVPVDKHRIRPPELGDARGDDRNLFFAVGPGVARPGDQLRHRAHLGRAELNRRRLAGVSHRETSWLAAGRRAACPPASSPPLAVREPRHGCRSARGVLHPPGHVRLPWHAVNHAGNEWGVGKVCCSGHATLHHFRE